MYYKPSVSTLREFKSQKGIKKRMSASGNLIFNKKESLQANINKHRSIDLALRCLWKLLEQMSPPEREYVAFEMVKLFKANAYEMYASGE